MKHTGKVQGALAFFILLGFFAVLGALIRFEGHSNMRDALLILVGSLGTLAGTVVTFYFGSSSGSQAKDQLLANKEPPQ